MNVLSVWAVHIAVFAIWNVSWQLRNPRPPYVHIGKQREQVSSSPIARRYDEGYSLPICALNGSFQHLLVVASVLSHLQ